MRMKEYNAYMLRRNAILQKLDSLNIEGLILNHLQSQDIIIEDKNIGIVVKMIKKIIFDYNMYGKDTTVRMLDDNQNYLISSFTNGDKNSIEQLKNITSLTLIKNGIGQTLNQFILSEASIINQNINKQYQKDVNKYIYVAQ